MTTFYSDLFSDISAPQVFVADKRTMPDVAHGREYYIRAELNSQEALTFGEPWSIRLAQLQSSARVHSMLLSVNNDGSTRSEMLVLKNTGSNHGGDYIGSAGAGIERFWFRTGLPASAHDRVDAFTGTASSTTSDFDRGKALWQLTTDDFYSADPMEDWDMVLGLVFGTSNSTSARTLLLEIFYTSGSS